MCSCMSFFLFKQKTAYELRISYWSSDVCSSDLLAILVVVATLAVPSFSYLVAKSRVKAAAIDLEIALVRARSEAVKRNSNVTLTPNTGGWKSGWKIGRASCRERGCQ